MSLFLEVPEKFSNSENSRKISNLKILELFYLHILNMTRSSLHTRGFRRIHLSDTNKLKMVLRARKVPEAFEKLDRRNRAK